MAGRTTTDEDPSFLPKPKAMRVALATLGILDDAPDPVFDSLAALAVSACDADGAEIAFLRRGGSIRKSVAGTVPASQAEGDSSSIGRASIVMHLFDGALDVTIGEIRVHGPRRQPVTHAQQALLEQIARQAAVQIESRYHRPAETSTQLIGIAVTDSGALLLAATPELQEMYGWSVSDLVGTSMAELLHPDDFEAGIEAFGRTSAYDGAKVPMDVRMRAADGSWIPTEFTADNCVDDDEIGGIVFVVRDQRARSRPDALIGGEARVLESVARGAPLPVILRMLATLVEAQDPESWCVIMLVDETGQRLEPMASNRMSDAVIDSLRGVPVAGDSASCGMAAFRLQSVLSEDLRVDPSSERWRRPVLEAGLTACWSHPVLDFDHRRALGTVDVYRKQRGRPSNEQARLLDLCTQLVSTAVEHASAQDRLTYQATHDPLTGLPNRTRFLDELGDALADAVAASFEPTVAVLFVDLDEFKLINDSLGHTVGDVLLQQVAERLVSQISRSDTIARFGGDEFTLLLRGVSTVADAQAVGQRLLHEVSRPYQVDGRELVISASVGVAIASQEEDSPAGLLRDSDSAMYRAKARGRLHLEVFDEGMRAAATARLGTEQELRRAIADEQLRLVFQPEIRLRDGSVTGLEALARWDHPTRGVVPPAAFIPVAEETGLIMPLGEWVLSETCRVARLLADDRAVGGAPGAVRPSDAGGNGHASNGHATRSANEPDPFVVWANVSARQLSGSDLVAVVERALASSGADPGGVGLEVTESALMADTDAAIEVLHRLKELGVQLAIDDFGTGYSSLSYLKKLPIDVVKIDQSFIAGLGRSPEDSAIVAAVIGLTETLGLRSLAEGVETESQRAALEELGCELAQGFLFSHPVPLEQLSLSGSS